MLYQSDKTLKSISHDQCDRELSYVLYVVPNLDLSSHQIILAHTMLELSNNGFP